MFRRGSKNKEIELEQENKLLELTSVIDSIAKKGSNIETSIDSINVQIDEKTQQIGHIESSIDEVQEIVESLEKELRKAKSKRENLETQHSSYASENEKLKSELADLTNEIESLDKEYETEGKKLIQIRESWKKELHRYKSNNGTVTTWKSFGNPISPRTIISIGDLHGWAPSFLNCINEYTEYGLEILGHSLDKEMIERRFPNPLEAKKSGRHLPRVGLNGHPYRVGAESTVYDGLMINGIDENTTILQVGDMIDRGDHNEVILEFARQFLIKAPGSFLSVIGNHEAWIIEGDYETWKKNEDRYRMHGRPRPGTTIHDPIMTGIDDLEMSMKTSFAILEGAVGAYLLSQHFSVYECLDEDGKQIFDKTYQNTYKNLSKPMEFYRRAVLKGGWELHEIGRNLLKDLRELSHNEEVYLPGSFNLISIENNVFCHAEANGLSHSQTDLDRIIGPVKWCNLESFFLISRMDKSQILDSPLLYARSKDEEGTISEGLEKLIRHIPSAGRYIHGHTPHNEEPEKELEVVDKNITLINCDLGHTPIYRSLWHDNPYDTSIVPYVYKIELSEEGFEDE